MPVDVFAVALMGPSFFSAR
jgi:hypothetical protein